MDNLNKNRNQEELTLKINNMLKSNPDIQQTSGAFKHWEKTQKFTCGNLLKKQTVDIYSK